MRRAEPPSRSRARASTARTSATVAETAESSSNAAPVVSATTRASVVFPLPGRPVEDQRRHAVLEDREPQRRALAERVPLPHHLVERARPDARRERREGRQPLLRRVREEIPHARSMLRAMATEDYTKPILPGRGGSDYERYLRTDDLLELQKEPDEMVHRDELLFQTVHQSSELWLKLCGFELETATQRMTDGDLADAIRLLRRAVDCVKITHDLLDMLEHMSPWEYQEIRRVLGHGSGFDSPGWRRIRHAAPALGESWHKLRRAEGLSIVELYQRGPRVRAALPARRAADRARRADHDVARAALQGRRARDRRRGRRHAGHACRAARLAREEEPLPGALEGAHRHHERREGVRLSQIWAQGDYSRVAERFADMHAELVELLAPRPGERWLDVATGTGGVALRAARSGADVTGLDITPALLERAAADAAAAGLEVALVEGTAEELPFEDAALRRRDAPASASSSLPTALPPRASSRVSAGPAGGSD